MVPVDNSTLHYEPPKPRRKRLRVLLAALPLLYLSTYATLRVSAVYYLFFDQGSWEVEGGTGLRIVDFIFLPAILTESEIQNRLRWLPEPKGG
jgi:hypothetical protein